MRFSILIFTLILATNSNAAECTAYDPEVGEEISIAASTHSPDLYFSTPEIVGGEKLTAMYIRGFRYDELDLSSHLLMPITFEIKDGVAEASIWMRPGLFKARVEAKYGDEVCGPRINAYIPEAEKH